MPSFMQGVKPTSNPFGQGPPSPAMPGVNAPVEPESLLAHVGQGVVNLAGGVANEGMAGVLDPVGAMDRQRAAKELQRKFQVVGDDHQGERLPNQVSPAEYEQIVKTYSDIRLGRSDLLIDDKSAEDPGAYRANVMDDIGDIMQTASGRSLIGQLSNNARTDASGAEIRHKTTLHPKYFENPDGSVLRDPQTGKKAIDDTTATETGYKDPGFGAPFLDGRPGAGSAATIAFNPNQDVRTEGGGAFRSDVVLFHEMVHALHDTRGTTDIGTVSALDGVRRDLANGVDRQGLQVPERALATDTGAIVRGEHQAVGLGMYRDDQITENAYRRERQQVALSGQGMPGDFLMEQRDHYAGYRGTYNNFNGT